MRSRVDSTASSATTTESAIVAAPLDLTGAPKLESLSLKERELCGALRIYPQQVNDRAPIYEESYCVDVRSFSLSLSLVDVAMQYVLIKETLIRESLRHGGQMPKVLARKLIKIGALPSYPEVNQPNDC